MSDLPEDFRLERRTPEEMAVYYSTKLLELQNQLSAVQLERDGLASELESQATQARKVIGLETKVKTLEAQQCRQARTNLRLLADRDEAQKLARRWCKYDRQHPIFNKYPWLKPPVACHVCNVPDDRACGCKLTHYDEVKDGEK